MDEWEQYKVRKSDDWEQYKIKEKPRSLLETIGRGAIETIPPALGVGGAMVGAPLGPLGILAGGGLATYGGAHIRDILKQQLFKEPIPPETTRAMEAAIGAVSAGPEFLGAKATGKMLGPWAKRMAPEQMRLAEQIGKYKIPVSPTAYAPTRFAKMPQAIVDWLPTGRIWANVKRGQIADGLLRMRQATLGKIPKIGEPISRLKLQAQDALKKVPGELEQASKKAYQGWVKKLGAPDITIPMDDTLNVIEKYRTKIMDSKTKSFLNKFTEKKLGREWTPETLDIFQSQSRKATGRAPYIHAELSEAMKRDVMKWDGELGQKAIKILEEAREKWTQKIAFSKNPFVRSFGGRFGNMKRAMETAMPDEILSIKKLVDKDTWKLMETNYVQELLDDATKVSAEISGEIFLPERFAGNFYKIEETIQKAMPEIYPQLRDFAMMSRTVASDVAKTGKGEGWWMGSALLGMGGAAYMEPMVAIPAGGSLAIAKTLMNPKGWMRAWLTEGLTQRLPGKLAIPLVKGGIRFGALKAGKKMQQQFEEEYGFPVQ